MAIIAAFAVQSVAPVLALDVEASPSVDTTTVSDPVVAPSTETTTTSTTDTTQTTQVESNVTVDNSSITTEMQTSTTLTITDTSLTDSTATVETPSIIPTDTTPPVITDIAVISVLSNETTIVWTTDELTHSTIEYGATPSYGQTLTLSVSAALAHLAVLTGLQPGALYYYCIYSTDLYGNQSSVCDQQFTTAEDASLSQEQTPVENTLPIITNISVSNLTENSATISWQTNEPTTHQVEYGIDSTYGSTIAVDASLDNSHSVTITGLTPDTHYHFLVRSFNGSNHEAVSVDNTFVTAASSGNNLTNLAAPTISAISAAITASSITITWNTDVPTTTELAYGLDASYGTTISQGSTLSESHSITITGLDHYTNYHYRLTSISGNGQASSLGGQEFTTLPEPIVIDSAPEIQNINASANTTSATISWETNEAANSQVEFGFSPSYVHSTALNANLTTSHNVSLSGLSSGTTYHYRVISQDTFGNTAYSNDLTLTTSPAASGNGNVNALVADTTAPTTVANLSAGSHGTQSINLNLGNVPSDAYRYDIRYSLNQITVANFSAASAVQSAPLYADEISDNSYTVAGLNPNTHYYFAVKISDSSDNWSAISNIADASTPAASSVSAGTESQNAGSQSSAAGGGGSSTAFDMTAPRAAGEVKAFGENRSISLFWKNPTEDFLRTAVVRNENRYPDSPTDGQVIYEGSGATFTDTNLVNGKKYFYAIYTYDDAKNYSTSAKISTFPDSANNESRFNALPKLIPVIAKFTLTDDLRIGARGDDVVHVQRFLATDKSVYPTGEVTGYFGPKTQEAVYEFQGKYRLERTGIINAETRAKIMEIVKNPQIAQTSAFVTLPIKSNLCQGARGEEVKALQTFFFNYGYMPQNLITSYFWTITKAAVAKFQAEYGDVRENGCVGPNTLEQMNEVIND